MSDELEEWEREASAFLAASGYLRPGKDYSMYSGRCEQREGDRNRAWRIWCMAREYRVISRVAEPEPPTRTDDAIP